MDISRSAPDVLEEGGNGEDNGIVNSGDFDGEIKLGMEVGSEEEAYNLYNAYAFKKGFSIRKATRRLINGVIRQREYVCSKQGFKEFEDPCNAKKFNHLDTRTGCTARIRFDVKNDVWGVAYFNDTHNHEFASPEQRCNLRSGRKVLNTHGSTTSATVSTSIKAMESCSCLSKELNGASNVGFTTASLTNSRTKIVKDKLREVLQLVEKDVAAMTMLENVGQECLQEDPINSDDMEPCFVGDNQVFDSPYVGKEEITNAKIKSQLEKKRKTVKDATTSQTPQPSHMVHGDGQSSSSSLELSFDNQSFSLTRTLQESTSMPNLSLESTTSKDGMLG
uniref:FAR1 domain-containing protein n=1 Tax=Fagus sylvatica TaxID=28930 RepID=A0A2N9F5N9_FAGSY